MGNNTIKTYENVLLEKRGWVSKYPKKAVFICSGGMDSTITMARLLKEKQIEIFPLFINRGQTNLKYEKQALAFFEKYLKKNHANLFRNVVEITINVPPSEIKDNLRGYSKKFGYPLRNTVLQVVGVQYAISLSEKLGKRISSVFCAQVKGDPFPHSKLISLRATTVDVCQSLDEWDWQITSPNIDPLLRKIAIGKKDMVQWAAKNDFPIEKTRSCYSGNKLHCGNCLTCRRRKEAFIKASLNDKTKYLE